MANISFETSNGITKYSWYISNFRATVLQLIDSLLTHYQTDFTCVVI